MKSKRREFLQSVTAVAGGILLGGTKKVQGNPAISDLIKIEDPFHGAILNNNHGTIENGELKIRVQGEAPMNCNVTVNGIPATREGTKFVTELALRGNETDIIAKANGWFGENSHGIRVVWDKNSFPRYGFEIDDNIFFLRDIAKNKYHSIFDNFYLKGLRNLNLKYGTKFTLNIYYTDGLEFTNEEEFTLMQFPEKYKTEWTDNSDWLKLTFHAYSNKPDRPYQYTRYQQLISDLEKVTDEIHRFAGEKTYNPPSIIHWGMIPPTAFKPLAQKGVRVLRGYFRKSSNGVWDVNQGLDNFRSDYLSHHDALKDFESEIIFARVDMVINSTPIEQIVPKLVVISNNPNKGEVIDLMTHEQYFWKFYPKYIPDHFERIDKALRWVTENGYKPVFFHDCFPGISGQNKIDGSTLISK